MGMFGLFGSESKSSNTATNVTTTNETAIQGDVGTFAAPGATISGLSGAQVQGLLDTLTQAQGQATASIANLGGSLAAGLQTQSQELAQIVAATRAPETNMMTQLMPLFLVGLIIWAVTRRGKHG